MIRGGIFWIASYPKSGNTWVRCLLSSLLSDGATPDLARLGRFCRNGADRELIEGAIGSGTNDMSTPQLITARSAAYLHFANDGLGRRCLKVHDRYLPSLFLPEATAGAIYIVRDPRDIAVSLAAHFAVPLDDAINFMSSSAAIISGAPNGSDNQTPQIIGMWSENVASWRALSNRPFLLLRYEDMLADPYEAARRLSQFLDIKATRALIERAVAACGFEKLRGCEEKHGFVEKPFKMERFFREGRAGTWQHILTTTQTNRILADHRQTMRELGYSI